MNTHGQTPEDSDFGQWSPAPQPDPDAAYDRFVDQQLAEEAQAEQIARPVNDLILALGNLATRAQIEAAHFRRGSWEWTFLSNVASRYRQAQLCELEIIQQER